MAGVEALAKVVAVAVVGPAALALPVLQVLHALVVVGACNCDEEV
jgi:hypothetical protein